MITMLSIPSQSQPYLKRATSISPAMPAINTMATEPSCDAAFEAIVALLSCSHLRPVCHHWSMSSEVTVHGRGPSSRKLTMSAMPSLNWSARSSHCPTTDIVM